MVGHPAMQGKMHMSRKGKQKNMFMDPTKEEWW